MTDETITVLVRIGDTTANIGGATVPNHLMNLREPWVRDLVATLVKAWAALPTEDACPNEVDSE